MKLRINAVVQVLGTALQVLNYSSGFVPPKWQWLTAGIFGIVQGVSGIASHYSNPDGTPATTPYVPPR
jgi:hypothetical protein